MREKKFDKQPSPEQLLAVLHINGDENLLLEKFSKGDKAAFVQLVMLQMPSIISFASSHQYFELPLSDLKDTATNAVIKMIEEQAALLSAGKLKGNWQENRSRYMFQAILQAMENISSTKRKSYGTPGRITFLSNLNRMLKKLEQEIVDRAILCLETGEQKQRSKDAFTVDYMVDAEVSYFTKKSDYQAHIFYASFDYETTIKEKDYGMLLYNGDDSNWHRESFMPVLDEPYGYLLHDLMDHSRMGDKIFDIERIWVDIIFTDQKGIKVKKDGQSRLLYLSEKKGYFV